MTNKFSDLCTCEERRRRKRTQIHKTAEAKEEKEEELFDLFGNKSHQHKPT